MNRQNPLFATTIEKILFEKKNQIEKWFDAFWAQHRPVLTCSVDIRQAGYKMTVVDTNLYPAGFHHLDVDSILQHATLVKEAIHFIDQSIESILIVCENHTRNISYYQSVLVLERILKSAGYKTYIGSFLTEEKPFSIEVEKNNFLTLHPLLRENHQLICQGHAADLILLNNDLSEGVPKILNDLSQPIHPSPKLGWATRSKTSHFTFFQSVATQLCDEIGIDPWLISPLFMDCGNIDFMSREGIDCLNHKTEKLLLQIQLKYNQYRIDDNPFVMIKADSGTYGMAVMPIHSADQFIHLNRKQRSQMSKSKGNRHVNHVIIQEGIPTVQSIKQSTHVAETVIYLLGQQVVGGFYRAHFQKNGKDNLNSPGMIFESINYQTLIGEFYAYTVLARLALAASSLENEALH